MLTAAYAADSAWNGTHFNHKRFNELLVAARAELVETKRYEMYSECQRILRDEGGAIVFLFRDPVGAADSKLKFTNVAGNFANDGHRLAERWWFES